MGTVELKKYIAVVLAKHPKVSLAFLFGSRARGTAKEYADVDLALEGDIDLSTILRVKGELENDTPLPYHFDVVNLSQVKNSLLGRRIAEEGQVIFSR